MKKYPLYLILLLLSCKKAKITDNTPLLPDKLSGAVQKGPFVIGSSITLYELDNTLIPTGRIFNTQTTDNKGTFQFDIQNLSSRYVNLKADGFYFNEDFPFITNAQLTLYSLADIADTTAKINVNIFTHLVKPRIEYLMQNGNSYSASKQQAQREILNIFGFTKPNIKPFENLDITQAGDDNALLLAASLILQSTNYTVPWGNFEGKFSERLALISNDIKTDGILNNDEIFQFIRNGAFLINETDVRTNLTNKYSELGQPIADLDIRKYVDSFLVNSSVSADGTSFFYPDKLWDPHYNILRLSDSVFAGTSGADGNPANSTLLMVAYVPINSSLTIKVEELDSMVNTTGKISYALDVKAGGFFDMSATHSKTFILPEKTTQYHLDLAKGFYYQIKYYENGSNSPTRQKIIKVI